ncbi:MAG: endolytic transglycosylase MltG [Lautropia sp.]|nr:endolytic transglycosylase MltG [Lautropia sp.]
MRVIYRSLALALVIALVFGGWHWWDYQHRAVVPDGEQVSFEVPRGQAGVRLAPVLQQAGIAVPAWKLSAAFRWRGDAGRIKAGRYTITGPATLPDVLGILVAGQVEKGKLLTLIDGWGFREVRAALKRAPDLVDTVSALSDAELMSQLGAPAGMLPEGRFAPDTYEYRPGSTDVELLKRAFVLQQQRLAAAWESRQPALKLNSPDELLTLASIVEKETGREEDRDMVASVFHNRLRVRMPLQSDPTTIYGLGERFDGNLRRKDLKDPSPYNTYVHRGLPPGPIAMPGVRALTAAANPASSPYFYFVARGDGSSEFSKDLASHNRAVNRFQRRQGQGVLHGPGAAAIEDRS